MRVKHIENNKKDLVINFSLFAFLYFFVTYNREYIRPLYAGDSFSGILTGSYSNFAAAYIISLFSVAPIFFKNLNKGKSRLVFYGFAVLLFLLLILEKFSPFAGASKVYDVYDIIASTLGNLLAFTIFEIIIRIKK